jgi:hypothetical protein
VALPAYEADKMVVPLSLIYETCNNCNVMSTIYLTLCRKCTNGFYGEYFYEHEVGEKDDTKQETVYSWIEIPCKNCGERFEPGKENPRELEFFTTLSRYIYEMDE